MKTITIMLATAGLILTACAAESPVERSELVVQPVVAATGANTRTIVEAQPVPFIRGRARLGTTATGRSVSPGKANNRMALAAAMPWAGGQNGVWEGTGHDDPEEMRKLSDSEVLERAMNVADKGADRQHALVSIGRRRVAGAVEAFRSATQVDEDQEVREMGLSGIMEHGGSEGLQLAWEMLRNDPSAQLRGLAIWAVAMWGTSEARRAIDVGLKDDDAGVKGMAVLAVWALVKHPNEALPILQSAAQSDEKLVWQEGLNVLMRMPYPEAGEILERVTLAADDETKMRMAAAAYRNWAKDFPELSR